MADPKTDLVVAWVRAAQDDLGSAAKLVEGETIYPGTALYHCQQCAEKSLKAFLLLNDIEFEKTHNLSVLVEMCADKNPGFRQLAQYAETLTPYATLYRYPEEIEPAELDQAVKAIEMAKAFLVFVTPLLPKDGA